METNQTEGKHDGVANALVLTILPTLRTRDHLWTNDRALSGSAVGIQFWTTLRVIDMLFLRV